MRSARPFKLLAGIIAGSCSPPLLAVTPAYAAISGHSATNTATTVTYSSTTPAPRQYARTYVDTDRNTATGLRRAGSAPTTCWRTAACTSHNGGGWSWTLVRPSPSPPPAGSPSWTVNRASLGETATPNDADLVFQVESPLETSAKYTHVYSGGGGGGSSDVTYTASSDNFANPERGLYHHTGDCDKNDFSLATLQGYRTSQGSRW